MPLSAKPAAVYCVTLPSSFQTFLTLPFDCVMVRLGLVLTTRKYLVAPVDGLHLKVTDVPGLPAPLDGESRLGAAGLVVMVVLPPELLPESVSGVCVLPELLPESVSGVCVLPELLPESVSGVYVPPELLPESVSGVYVPPELLPEGAAVPYQLS